ncbi:MAG TPA: hypothetical protein VGE96_07240 [Steroidobacteraceae bacterium]|jgi:hypothetical protein
MSSDIKNGNGTDGRSRQVRSLRELAQPVQPPRDLWPAISAGMRQSAPAAGPAKRSSQLRWMAVAATVLALAVGIWIGRTVMPNAVAPATQTPGVGNPSPNVLAAGFVTDPRYLKDRAQLVRGLEARLKTLPPETQQKVAASLATIRKSKTELEAALGRDPANALLQELLVNTYQDEMRVLTSVHEAGDGQEI